MNDSNNINESKLAWELMVELRKEILENIKTRSQLMTIKFTFIGALFSVLLYSLLSDNLTTIKFGSINIGLVSLFLIIINIINVSFDVISSGYEISTNRIAYYIRTKLEPKIINKQLFNNRENINFLSWELWETYISKDQAKFFPDNQLIFTIGSGIFTLFFLFLTMIHIGFIPIYSERNFVLQILASIIFFEAVSFLSILKSRQKIGKNLFKNYFIIFLILAGLAFAYYIYKNL